MTIKTQAAYTLYAEAAKQERRAADLPLAKAVDVLLAAMQARLQAIAHERAAR